MHRKLFALAHLVATNPWLALASGLFIAGIGALELRATGQGVLDIAFSSELGLLLTGLQQAAFGLTNLVMGVRLAGIGVLGAEHDDHHPVFNRMLKGFVENPYLSFSLGLMLVAMVAADAWGEWVAGGTGEARSVWYFGLALMGLLVVARNTEYVLLGLGMMADGEAKGGFALRLANRINRHVRKPWVLVAVAVTCIVLGIGEELFATTTGAQGPAFIAHYGLLLFAALEVGKLIPILFFGSILADEGLAPYRST
jgi:hypothetical protein